MGSVTRSRERYSPFVFEASDVRLEIDAGVAVVTIDRPEARNAIGFATIDALGAAVDEVADSGAAVLVLRGSGDRAFVSGGDIKELGSIRTHEAAVAMASRVRRLLDRVAAFPVPVIAALNGHALGGGAEVAVAADIRIAADDVKIGFNQVALGIMPAWGGAERLAQLVGRSRALLAIATGDVYDAPTAQRFGLVDVVVPRADVRRRMAGARTPAGGIGSGHDARREGRRRRGSPVFPPRARGRCNRRVRAVVDGRRALGRGRSVGARSGERDDASL